MSHHREAVAYHEAGHAVVARLLHFDVDYVTLKSIGDASGHCMITKTGWRRTPKQAELLLIITMAGQLAQAKYTGDPTSDGSYEDDNRHIKSLQRETHRSRDELGDEAVALVKNNWAAISDVARELLSYETISGERLDIIISRVGPPQ